MTEYESLRGINNFASEIFDIAPDNMEAADVLSALSLVAAFTICHSAASRPHALEGAKVFHDGLTRFIDSHFSVVSGADTGGVH